MPKSSVFGGRRRSADVNVISAEVRRSSARRARIAFVAADLIAWVLAALTLSVHMQPVVAVFVGALVAFPAAVVVYVAVLVWPVARILIHWFPEIALGGLVLGGMSGLDHLVAGPVVVATLFAVAGGLMLPPPLRRRTLAVAWCVISRHRLRMSFAAFIRGNREGTLPFILHAHPTPVGERVYVWLRPGLSLEELVNRGDQLAVSCWAKAVTVEAASRKYAALLRFDIKRRDTLALPVDSPLAAVPDAPAREDQGQDGAADVTALDLTDIPEQSANGPTEDAKPAGRKPAMHKFAPTPKTATAGVVSEFGEDISDYI